MILEMIAFILFITIGVLWLYIEHRIKTKHNAEIYNNIKKLDDADRL